MASPPASASPPSADRRAARSPRRRRAPMSSSPATSSLPSADRGAPRSPRRTSAPMSSPPATSSQPSAVQGAPTSPRRRLPPGPPPPIKVRQDSTCSKNAAPAVHQTTPATVRGPAPSDNMSQVVENPGLDAPTSDGVTVLGDGTFVVVDCIEGVTLQTTKLLQQALHMGLRPVLMLNGFHKLFLNKMDGEEAYQYLCAMIKKTNTLIRLHNHRKLKEAEVSPAEGTVQFFSDTWAFSIPVLANICELRLGSDHDDAMKRLWGESYYNPSTKLWTTAPTSPSCKRGFVYYVYDPIRKILNCSLRGQKIELQSMMQKVGRKKMELQGLEGEKLFDHVMQTWLPITHIFSKDPTCFNSEDSFWVGDDDALEERNPAYFCLMPKGSAKGQFTLPPEVLDRLASYQIEGVRWLWDLHCRSVGGVLADDMGMGKTRMVCSFLRGLLHCALIKRAIIVAPKSILTQWQTELGYVGLKEQTHMYRRPLSEGESLRNVIKRGGVLLTTYGVFRSRHKIITSEATKMTEWNYVFLDEGHRIKNESTQTSQAFSTLKCKNKIVITGTPFQNNLKELYVLVNFCCPNLLGDEQEFIEKFVEPIDRAKFADSQLALKRRSMLASEELKEVLRPYMLRRTKRLLQSMGLLGIKHEMTVWIEMAPVQIKLYKALLTEVRLGNSGGVPLAEAAVAKNICNHPLILRKLESGDEKLCLETQGLANNYKKQLLDLVPLSDFLFGYSSKVSFIIYLVKKLILEEHKILVFSQSVQMLQLLEGIFPTGNTSQPERDDDIKTFQANIQNPEKISPKDVPDVFLMTTSVGGMGLNLTAASRVVIVDPAQNPSMDNQSVDRAYRLGQKKDVIVYRLITAGTIEEHTYRQQVIKGEVSTSVTEKEQCTRALEKETGRVLSLQELWDSYHTPFHESILEHVESIKGHRSVVGVNNHGSLFSVEECLPLPCGDESPIKLARHYRKKVACDTVIGGEKHACEVNDAKWDVHRNKYTGIKPLPKKNFDGSSRPAPKEPDAATGAG